LGDRKRINDFSRFLKRCGACHWVTLRKLYEVDDNDDDDDSGDSDANVVGAVEGGANVS